MAFRFNLFQAMLDPNLLVKRDDLITIVKDKYPKGDFHYLVLPNNEIQSISHLRMHHIPLLKHMELKARELARSHSKGTVFWIGYHAQPSMHQLHLHVVSGDFNGHGLKTKKHWNSFTTAFFMPSTQVIYNLELMGRVNIPSSSQIAALLETPLKCNKCESELTNMPTLKLHLLSHSISSRMS